MPCAFSTAGQCGCGRGGRGQDGGNDSRGRDGCGRMGGGDRRNDRDGGGIGRGGDGRGRDGGDGRGGENHGRGGCGCGRGVDPRSIQEQCRENRRPIVVSECERCTTSTVTEQLYGAERTELVMQPCSDSICGTTQRIAQRRCPFWPSFARPRWLTCDELYDVPVRRDENAQRTQNIRRNRTR